MEQAERARVSASQTEVLINQLADTAEAYHEEIQRLMKLVGAEILDDDTTSRFEFYNKNQALQHKISLLERQVQNLTTPTVKVFDEYNVPPDYVEYLQDEAGDIVSRSPLNRGVWAWAVIGGLKIKNPTTHDWHTISHRMGRFTELEDYDPYDYDPLDC